MQSAEFSDENGFLMGDFIFQDGIHLLPEGIKLGKILSKKSY